MPRRPLSLGSDLTAQVRRALAAVGRLGCRDADGEAPAEATDEEAIAFLQSLGRKATPQSARALLVGLGIWYAAPRPR